MLLLGSNIVLNPMVNQSHEHRSLTQSSYQRRCSAPMRRLCAALAVVAAVTNALQCRAPRTVRARTAGLLRALDARQPGAASRRTAAGAAAVGALVTPDLAGAATTPAVEDVVENPALVWKQGEKRDAACNSARVRKAFPGPFVNYLSRFLLSYDEGSRAFWRAGSAEIPIAWDEQKVRRKRATQFANYAASVERGLCVYAEKSTTAAGDYSATPQLGVRQLLSLLKSRYGLLPDAQRQLSLLFSLLDPPLQPSEAIASLAARYENATVAAMDVVDGGSYAVSDAAALARLSARLPAPAAGGKAARLGAPRFAPTGKILGFIVTEAGCGYGAPPDVTVSAPPGDDARSRPARARAVVDDRGRLRGVELVDGGVGYVPSGPENDVTVVLDVAAPPDNSACGVVATADAILEYALVGVDVVARGNPTYGYTRAQSLGAVFGDVEGVRALRPAVATARLEYAARRNVPPPTAARWAPRDAASSSLTALLGVGLVPVWDGATHRFPAAAFGRIEGASRSMRSDMTPVRRPVELRGGQLVRLALAGAICTATTRAVLNPLELSKTRAQAAASGGARDDDDAHGAASPWLGVEATAAAGAALGTSSFGVYELLQRALPKLSCAVFADPGFATAHELELSLASSFGAVLVAAALVAPLEAAKVRLMLSEEPSPPSLRSSLLAVAADGDELRPAKLWDGFYPLLARELPFTTAKLLVYSSAQQALFQLLPAARERPLASLGVTVFCGALAGAAGALLSTPADAVVTELATGKHGSDWTKALAAITGAEGEAEAAGPGLAAVPRLFAGAAQRCLLFAVIITVQLLLFDFCRDKLQVSPENLSLSLDVFADRLSFYEY